MNVYNTQNNTSAPTCSSQALQATKTAGWATIHVSSLNPSEKQQIVTGYLEGIYGKTLSEQQKSLVVDAPQTNNPLYMRALLDEVRVIGTPKQGSIDQTVWNQYFANLSYEYGFHKGRNGFCFECSGTNRHNLLLTRMLPREAELVSK